MAEIEIKIYDMFHLPVLMHMSVAATELLLVFSPQYTPL